MQRKTVYRIEHLTQKHFNNKNVGIGCYNEVFSKNMALQRKHNHSDKHPNIWKDFPNRQHYKNSELMDYFCACDSISKLYEWFHGFIENLFNEGFAVVSYQIPVTHYTPSLSGRQCFFHMDKALYRKVLMH